MKKPTTQTMNMMMRNIIMNKNMISSNLLITITKMILRDTLSIKL